MRCIGMAALLLAVAAGPVGAAAGAEAAPAAGPKPLRPTAG
jgi:hypothetical protein